MTGSSEQLEIPTFDSQTICDVKLAKFSKILSFEIRKFLHQKFQNTFVISQEKVPTPILVQIAAYNRINCHNVNKKTNKRG